MTNKKNSEYRKKEDIKRIFFPKEWNSLYNSLPNTGYDLKFYFNFLLQTGARYNEAAHVKVEDIDSERKTIAIKYAKARIGGFRKIKIVCLKCNQKINLFKTISFCPLCGQEIANKDDIIKTYKDKISNRRRDARRVKISDKFYSELMNKKNELKLTSTDTFKFPTIQHMNQTMKRILKKQNVKDWRDFSPHNIRKTHENYMLASGSNVLSLGYHMGHSIAVASAYYIANNLFSEEEIGMIKMLLDNLKI